MSLKAFHLVFIIAAIALTLGFGVWSMLEYNTPHGTRLDLVFGVGSLVAAAALVGYEIYFLKKLKNVSYL
jgi:hypothetical protein